MFFFLTLLFSLASAQATSLFPEDPNTELIPEQALAAPNLLRASIPTKFPFIIDPSGQLNTANSGEITNYSEKAIAVIDIDTETTNGWQLVPFQSSVKTQKPNTKEIGMEINSCKTNFNGFCFEPTAFPLIETNSSIPIQYQAVFPKQTNIQNVGPIATTFFIVGWAD